jgi:hypothetical protein
MFATTVCCTSALCSFPSSCWRPSVVAFSAGPFKLAAAADDECIPTHSRRAPRTSNCSNDEWRGECGSSEWFPGIGGTVRFAALCALAALPVPHTDPSAAAPTHPSYIATSTTVGTVISPWNDSAAQSSSIVFGSFRSSCFSHRTVSFGDSGHFLWLFEKSESRRDRRNRSTVVGGIAGGRDTQYAGGSI